MAKWWDMSVEELAHEAETGLRTPEIRPQVTSGILEFLHTKVAIETAERQDRLTGRLVFATWILAGATIALGLSTVGLALATLTQ